MNIRATRIIAGLIALTLTSCVSNSHRSEPQGYQYGCLTITTLRANPDLENYLWVDPSAGGDSARVFRTDAKGMGDYFGLPGPQCNRSGILNHLTRMGWRLVDVERQESYSVNGILTPDHLHYHFTRKEP